MHKKLGSTLIVPMLVLLTLLAGCGATPAPTAVPIVPTAVPPAATAVPPAPTAAEPAKLILATTTSTENSGLLAVILPDFQERFNATVEVVAVGTGQAIKLGEDGNADVLLVHARALEDAFMAAGHGTRREDVMYNDFIILGPESDPAGIKGLTNAAEALGLIAEAQSPFVSRGDDSGTHVKEKDIWAAAGITPAGDWYISAGQGMGAVLTMADEQQAYTLSDRATYLARTLEGTDLVILVEGDAVLFNPYGVITVNPNKGPHIQTDLANSFVDWIISLETQELIQQFGVAEFGQSLFIPDSAPWRAAHPKVALQITGLVGQEQALTMDQLKAMDVVTVEVEHPKKGPQTGEGVRLNALLDLAQVKPEATTLVILAADGFSAEVALADVRACADCLIAFNNEGNLKSMMPGQQSNAWVKDVIQLELK